MLRRFSLQVIEKQHRMMEQLGSQIKVFISSHLRLLHKPIPSFIEPICSGV